MISKGTFPESAMEVICNKNNTHKWNVFFNNTQNVIRIIRVHHVAAPSTMQTTLHNLTSCAMFMTKHTLIN